MVAQAPAALAAEPVPVAILARTSTSTMQDPVASVRRQIRSNVLPLLAAEEDPS